MKPYQQFLAQWPIRQLELRNEKIDNGRIDGGAGLWSSNGADRISRYPIAHTCLPGPETACSGSVRDLCQA